MSPEPLGTAAGRIAVFVAASQPLYPLGLWFAGGAAAGRAGAVVLLVTPLLALVPLVARRNATAGRLLLVLGGTLVTVLAAVTLGRASLVEAYLLPAFVAAAALFRPGEGRWRWIALAIPMLALVLGPIVLPAQGWISPEAAASLHLIHAGGAVGLSLYIVWCARQAWRT